MTRDEFLQDTRLEARDALARIIAAYDAMTDYERMILPTAFRQAIEAAR